ncbi:hypothetical protein VDGL01_11222 [Verticillium dahliae]
MGRKATFAPAVGRQAPCCCPRVLFGFWVFGASCLTQLGFASPHKSQLWAARQHTLQPWAARHHVAVYDYCANFGFWSLSPHSACFRDRASHARMSPCFGPPGTISVFESFSSFGFWSLSPHWAWGLSPHWAWSFSLHPALKSLASLGLESPTTSTSKALLCIPCCKLCSHPLS